jgi:hypothetical protein
MTCAYIHTYIHRSITEEALEAKVNDMFNADPSAMKEGYAPFCKHLFVPNFIEGATVEAVPVCTHAYMYVLRLWIIGKNNPNSMHVCMYNFIEGATVEAVTVCMHVCMYNFIEGATAEAVRVCMHACMHV